MIKNFSSIIELKQIREQVRELQILLLKREIEFAKTKTKDYTIIPIIKELFCKKITNINKPRNRKKLLFVILCIVSPSTLAGCRLPKGLRAELSKIFPDIHPCVISNDISVLLSSYQKYINFRIEVDSIYKYILDNLKV